MYVTKSQNQFVYVFFEMIEKYFDLIRIWSFDLIKKIRFKGNKALPIVHLEVMIFE